MNIQTFIVKCMTNGYSYEDAWKLLDKAISANMFDFSILEDESKFSEVLNELAVNLI